MAPVDDPVNLIWKSLTAAKVLFYRILSDYGKLVLIPDCLSIRSMPKSA